MKFGLSLSVLVLRREQDTGAHQAEPHAEGSCPGGQRLRPHREVNRVLLSASISASHTGILHV